MLSLEKLVKKLLILLLLISGHRGQVDLALSLDRMETLDDGSVRFVLSKPMKTARTGQPLDTLNLPPYDRKPRLCVVKTLKEYIERTRPLRCDNDLFLSYTRPFGKVSRDTISRWVVSTLKEAGVGTDRYGVHSTRGAGVSTGAKLGAASNVLLSYGSWKSERTMAKHYRKPVHTSKQVPLGTVLLDNAQ